MCCTAVVEVEGMTGVLGRLKVAGVGVEVEVESVPKSARYRL